MRTGDGSIRLFAWLRCLNGSVGGDRSTTTSHTLEQRSLQTSTLFLLTSGNSTLDGR